MKFKTECINRLVQETRYKKVIVRPLNVGYEESLEYTLRQEESIREVTRQFPKHLYK